MAAQLFRASWGQRDAIYNRERMKPKPRQRRKRDDMKKVCRLDGLDCATCAAKIETAVQKLEGVSSASVNFMTTKLTIEGDEARMDEIMEQAAAIAKKVEPDVVVRKA